MKSLLFTLGHIVRPNSGPGTFGAHTEAAASPQGRNLTPSDSLYTSSRVHTRLHLPLLWATPHRVLTGGELLPRLSPAAPLELTEYKTPSNIEPPHPPTLFHPSTILPPFNHHKSLTKANTACSNNASQKSRRSKKPHRRRAGRVGRAKAILREANRHEERKRPGD